MTTFHFVTLLPRILLMLMIRISIMLNWVLRFAVLCLWFKFGTFKNYIWQTESLKLKIQLYVVVCFGDDSAQFDTIFATEVFYLYTEITWKTINSVLIHLMTRKISTLKLKSHPNIVKEPEYIFTNLIGTHLYFSCRSFFKSVFHVHSFIT